MVDSFNGPDDDSPEEREALHQLGIAEIENWFERLPEEERDRPALVTQDGEWTPRQLVEEVHAFTALGRRVAWMFNAVRHELASRSPDS